MGGQELFNELGDGFGLRVHEEAFATRDDMVVTVGQLGGEPVSFGFGRESIVEAVDEQDGHGQACEAVTHIEIMDDGQDREFVDKGPLLYFTKLLFDEGAGQACYRPCAGGGSIRSDNVVDDGAAQKPRRQDIFDRQAYKEFVQEPDKGMRSDLVIGPLSDDHE